MTKQRALILDIINKSYDHMTAEEVYKKAVKKMPGIALATVYNNINALFNSGEIRKFVLTDGSAHYDKQIPHDHLVCEKCGKICDITLKGEEFSALKAERLSDVLGQKITGYELIVKFVCDECKDKELSNEN